MSAATVNAERRLRRRVRVCKYQPLPREIADIATLLRMIDEIRAANDENNKRAVAKFLAREATGGNHA